MPRIFLIFAMIATFAVPLAAQISLPGVQLPRVGDVTGPLLDTVDETTRAVEELARDRISRIERFARVNRDRVDLDLRGEPARRGELLVMDADPAILATLPAEKFELLNRETVEGLDFEIIRIGYSEDMSLEEAQEALGRLLPKAEIAADNLHFQSGVQDGAALVAASASAAAGSASVPVGMIDGATGDSVPVGQTRGFAEGAPYPSNHGSAVASLLASAGVRDIRVADVYGTDKAGGNALAMAKGLGWLVGQGSKVVTISLVGPRNSVLERAIASAQRKGVVVVAAVGNDGPAAPPAYPASYKDVVAVSAVDRKRRALIEAGRALHLDYTAPGADIRGLDAKGKRIRLRGTSFATPLVAARVASAIAAGRSWRTTLDQEAIDLGPDGTDDTFGRGLVCASCRGR